MRNDYLKLKIDVFSIHIYTIKYKLYQKIGTFFLCILSISVYPRGHQLLFFKGHLEIVCADHVKNQ